MNTKACGILWQTNSRLPVALFLICKWTSTTLLTRALRLNHFWGIFACLMWRPLLEFKGNMENYWIIFTFGSCYWKWQSCFARRQGAMCLPVLFSKIYQTNGGLGHLGLSWFPLDSRAATSTFLSPLDWNRKWSPRKLWRWPCTLLWDRRTSL